MYVLYVSMVRINWWLYNRKDGNSKTAVYTTRIDDDHVGTYIHHRRLHKKRGRYGLTSAFGYAIVSQRYVSKFLQGRNLIGHLGDTIIIQ